MKNNFRHIRRVKKEDTIFNDIFDTQLFWCVTAAVERAENRTAEVVVIPEEFHTADEGKTAEGRGSCQADANNRASQAESLWEEATTREKAPRVSAHDAGA
ncbi:MAG: hypothetical protein Kow0037_30810 [Calditrichia bacterium]